MTIHVGLIGGGNITETHAGAARAIPEVEIAAIFGTNIERVKQVAREYGATPYQDLEAFLDHRPMDLVVIGSPSGLHAKHGIAAARHELHVLVEKPIDVSSEQADALISVAERAGVKLGVIFQDRFKPDIRRLKEIIDAGAVGRPILADARVKWYRPPEYYSASRWRGTSALDGGVLMNQGVHTLDLMLWLLGDVVSVQARTATTLHCVEAEDTAIALLEFAGGAVGVIQVTTAAYPGYPRRLEITGSEGTVILEDDRIIALDLRNAQEFLPSDGNQRDDNRSASPVVSDIRGHRAVLEDFIRAIQRNTRPACDGCEGRRSVALIEAIHRAAQTSRLSARVE